MPDRADLPECGCPECGDRGRRVAELERGLATERERREQVERQRDGAFARLAAPHHEVRRELLLARERADELEDDFDCVEAAAHEAYLVRDEAVARAEAAEKERNALRIQLAEAVRINGLDLALDRAAAAEARCRELGRELEDMQVDACASPTDDDVAELESRVRQLQEALTRLLADCRRQMASDESCDMPFNEDMSEGIQQAEAALSSVPDTERGDTNG